MRRVATPEGSRFYGLPIGAPISGSLRRKVARLKGPEPTGATRDDWDTLWNGAPEAETVALPSPETEPWLAEGPKLVPLPGELADTLSDYLDYRPQSAQELAEIVGSGALDGDPDARNWAATYLHELGYSLSDLGVSLDDQLGLDLPPHAPLPDGLAGQYGVEDWPELWKKLWKLHGRKRSEAVAHLEEALF